MKQKYLLLLVVFLFWVNPSNSQDPPYKKLLHKTCTERLYQIPDLYPMLLGSTSPEKTLEKIKEIKEYAIQEGDKSLVLEMDFFHAYYLGTERKDYRESLALLSRLKKEASRKGNNCFLIRILSLESRIYWNKLGNYEKAFIAYIKMAGALKKTSNEEYPQKTRELNKIANAYYYFQDYQLAISYFKKAISIPETPFNSHEHGNALNSLGLCYQKLGDFKKSNFYLHEILKLNDEKTKKIWWPIAMGNIGKNYFLQKKYDKATPFLQADLKDATAYGHYGRIVADFTLLAAIKLQKGHLDAAGQYIQKAETYINLSCDYDRFRLLYPIMSKWHSSKNQPEMAHAYLDSTLLAQKQYNDKFSALKIMRVKQRVFLREQKLKIAQLELDKQQKILLRNTLISSLILLIFIVLVLYLNQRKREIAKTLKLQSSEFALILSMEELEKSKLKLESFIHQTINKNRLIKEHKKKSNGIDGDKLDKLKTSTIITNEDWVDFQKLFEKAYPGFLFRLKNNYPSLTPSLVRVIVLTKLNIPTRGIADMLGISKNSVQVARHRIYKKLNVQREGALKRIIDSI